MSRLVRHKRILKTWALTTSDRKLYWLQSFGWWIVWVVVTILVFTNMSFVPALIVSATIVLAGGWVWVCGYFWGRRDGMTINAIVQAEWSGTHPEQIEFELKEGMKAKAAAR